MEDNLKDIILKNTIKSDCLRWQKVNNMDKLLEDYMYLNECKNSKENGLYQLIYNGHELWYGTLNEINAVVKSMIYKLKIESEINI